MTGLYVIKDYEDDDTGCSRTLNPMARDNTYPSKNQRGHVQRLRQFQENKMGELSAKYVGQKFSVADLRMSSEDGDQGQPER